MGSGRAAGGPGGQGRHAHPVGRRAAGRHVRRDGRRPPGPHPPSRRWRGEVGAAHPRQWVCPGGRWASVSVDGDAVVAIGGAPGGAHSNTRWTVWRGTTAAVPEHPQTFETFGGWGAGGLVGAVTLHGEPVLVGAWQSDAAALDIATWLAQGTRWVRQRSTGTVLANTPTRLRQAEAVAATSTLVVAVGSVTALDGGIFVTAAAWTAGSARGPWTAVGLPQAEGARAERVGCDAAACLVLGRSGTAVRAWWLDASGLRTVDLAGRTVGDGDHLLAPVVCGARAWLVLPGVGGADVVEA